MRLNEASQVFSSVSFTTCFCTKSSTTRVNWHRSVSAKTLGVPIRVVCHRFHDDDQNKSHMNKDLR